MNLWQFHELAAIADAILHKIPWCQIFPQSGGCEVFNFCIGNLVLIWLNYGTSPGSTLVPDHHHFSYGLHLFIESLIVELLNCCHRRVETQWAMWEGVCVCGEKINKLAWRWEIFLATVCGPRLACAKSSANCVCKLEEWVNPMTDL